MTGQNTSYTVEDIADKVGGRFRLTVLVQKRYKELNLWSLETGRNLPRDIISAILLEIWEGAIELGVEEELEMLDALTE